MYLSAWVVGMGGRTPVAMTRSGIALLARFTISLVNLYGFPLQLSRAGGGVPGFCRFPVTLVFVSLSSEIDVGVLGSTH